MKQIFENQSRICSCCHRELPLAAFYIDKHTQHPDRYCKECRKAVSKTRHKNTLIENERSYPVITRIADRELRMSLLLHALEVVNESVARKRKQQRDQEYRNDWDAEEH